MYLLRAELDLSNKRTTFRQRSWGAWAGDLRELEAIAGILRESTRERQQTAAKELEDLIESIGNESQKDVSDLIRSKLNKLKASHERILTGKVELFVRLDVEDQHETVSGQVAEVLSELDRRSTKSVTMTASPYRYLAGDIHDVEQDENSSLTEGIYVHLGSGGQFNLVGAEVRVSSPDTGWARSTFARLVDEIEKGVPRWARLRKHIMIPFAFLTSAFTILGFAIGYSLQAYWNDWWLAPFGGAFLGFMSIPFAYGEKLFGWLFPPFEVTGEGSQSSGGRRIAFLTSVLISIPIGVFVNSIS
ncbi:hypothetical protein [Micromonospora sp. DT229]|uniref:hypothetical protein n=1 Tax=Micromonospora sp. DT229 TaxID=3393430 RepID=UPI003CF2DA96